MPFRLANVSGRAAIVVGDRVHDLERASESKLGSDLMAALRRPDELAAITASLEGSDGGDALRDVTLGPPVPRPGKVFAIGLNYAAHAAEADLEVPPHPLVFTKYPSCLAGPTTDVRMRSPRCDYEAELVVVIGTGGKDIPRERAWDHVVGVMAGQDISDRRLQFATQRPQFSLAKSYDTFGPTGPWLVSTDALPDRDDLRVRCWVNGEARQNDRTAHMIRPVPELVAYLSRVLTLEPGDLIFTGTPEGVGGPKRIYLQDGDVIRTEIEGVGEMRNRCVSET